MFAFQLHWLGQIFAQASAHVICLRTAYSTLKEYLILRSEGGFSVLYANIHYAGRKSPRIQPGKVPLEAVEVCQLGAGADQICWLC